MNMNIQTRAYYTLSQLAVWTSVQIAVRGMHIKRRFDAPAGFLLEIKVETGAIGVLCMRWMYKVSDAAKGQILAEQGGSICQIIQVWPGSTDLNRTNIIQRAALLRMDKVGVATAPPLIVQVHKRQLACPVLKHNLHGWQTVPMSPRPSLVQSGWRLHVS